MKLIPKGNGDLFLTLDFGNEACILGVPYNKAFHLWRGRKTFPFPFPVT